MGGNIMKTGRKVLTTILATTTFATTLAGCGSNTMTSTTTTVTTETTTTTGSSYKSLNSSKGTSIFSDETAACAEAPASAVTENCYSYDSAMCGTEKYCWDNDEKVINSESYTQPEENGFFITAAEPLSTFAADVDTASYSNVRRMIEDGYRLSQINTDAVRAEEFINYFSYDLNSPKAGEKFGITTEIATCPWNTDHQLMFVGMKTQDIDFREAPRSNLVFLIDVSGSMEYSNKLPLLQASFKELVDSLPNNGTVSIVTYSGEERVVLSGESMRNKGKIKSAIDSLVASGCTNGEAGMKKAYQIAADNFIEGGNNRVIMATDGDLNVGISSTKELEKFIKTKKDDGIFLSVLGFGTGNLKDDKMQTLADCGNGNYSYIDSLFEGKKVLVDELGSTLVTVAKDVKLQVEFNPAKVNAYRLIGYENRIMDAMDFNDDTKDGGEMGAGHSIVALYEIIPEGSASAISLKYQENKEADYSNEYATVSVRYKEPDRDKSQLFDVVVTDESVTSEASDNLKFAGMVAEFAMILSDSDHKGDSSLEYIMATYKTLEGTDEYQDEFNQLVRMVAKRG
ncbi:MAG: VWA domain-containing protein [Butyrivibrio sp.]|nr:VWA domain-containing protein [Butyrivibrio sp.]